MLVISFIISLTYISFSLQTKINNITNINKQQTKEIEQLVQGNLVMVQFLNSDKIKHIIESQLIMDKELSHYRDDLIEFGINFDKHTNDILNIKDTIEYNIKEGKLKHGTIRSVN
jgi:hypothetical protein